MLLLVYSLLNFRRRYKCLASGAWHWVSIHVSAGPHNAEKRLTKSHPSKHIKDLLGPDMVDPPSPQRERRRHKLTDFGGPGEEK